MFIIHISPVLLFPFLIFGARFVYVFGIAIELKKVRNFSLLIWSEWNKNIEIWVRIKCNKIKWNEKCFLLRRCWWRLISFNWGFHITKLLHNKRLFSLQPLSHYFIVFENMCHQSRDCRSGWSNKFRIISNSKVVWPLLIRNCLSLLIMNLWNHTPEDCGSHCMLPIVCWKLFTIIQRFL